QKRHGCIFVLIYVSVDHDRLCSNPVHRATMNRPCSNGRRGGAHTFLTGLWQRSASLYFHRLYTAPPIGKMRALELLTKRPPTRFAAGAEIIIKSAGRRELGDAAAHVEWCGRVMIAPRLFPRSPFPA